MSLLESAVEHLEGARDQLVAHDFVTAFDSLLGAWRAIRAEAIADVCELFSRRAAKNQAPLSMEEMQTERILDWMRAFRSRSALSLGVLIGETESAYAANVAPRFLFPRIEALATVKDDPRVTTFMTRTAARIQQGGAWSKFLPQYVKALHMAEDPRFVALLDDAIAASPSARALTRGAPLGAGSKALRSLRARMKEGPPLLPAVLDPILRSVRDFIQGLTPDFVVPLPSRALAREGDPAALLEEVLREPDDHELRLVLADALMSVGDPRGEFIVLQCRRANNDDIEERSRSLSRERALLTEHIKTWIGPLAAVVPLGSAVFERGFLARCEAVAGQRVTAEVHFQHAEWATVRSITFRGQARITPHMRALREAIGVDYQGLLQLATTGHPKLVRLNMTGAAAYQQPPGTLNEAVRSFAACDPKKLPALTHLEIDAPYIDKPHTEWIWNATWRRQLRSIGVSSTARTVAAWIEELRRRDHLEEVSFLGGDHRVTVRKEASAADRLALIVELLALPKLHERGLIETLRCIQEASVRFADVRVHEETLERTTYEQRARLNAMLERWRTR